MKLKLAAIEWVPVSLLENHENGTISMKKCPIKSLLEILSKSLNFSYEIFSPVDNQYGIPNDDGSWNGMTGMLKRNECDITITPLTVTHERLSVIKFSKELFPDPYTISSQSKNQLEKDLIDFLKSVNTSIWLLLLVFILIIVILNSLNQKFRENKITYYEEFWHLFRVLLIQTHLTHHSLTLYSGLLSLYVLCYFIITNWFTSLIGSLLVVGFQKTLIETVHQLAEAKDVVPTLYFGTGIETYFRTSKLKDNQEVWRRIQANEKLALLKNDESYDNKELIDLLRAGKAAMIETHTDAICLRIYYCLRFPDLRMHISKETFYEAMQALGYRMDFDSNLMKKIDKLIHEIQAQGLLDKWFDEMFYNYAKTNKTDLMSQSEVESCIDNQFYKMDEINYIDLSNLRTSLYILSCGIGFALLILIIEITLDCYGFKGVFEQPKHKKYFKQIIVKQKNCSYDEFKIPFDDEKKL